ncbi:hypothetical protein ABPG74_019655 [Tetrahymena malaccensis]
MKLSGKINQQIKKRWKVDLAVAFSNEECKTFSIATKFLRKQDQSDVIRIGEKQTNANRKEKNQKIRRKKNQIKKLPKFKIEEDFFIHSFTHKFITHKFITHHLHIQYMHLPPTIQEHKQKQKSSKQKERKNIISMCEMLIEHNFRPPFKKCQIEIKLCKKRQQLLHFHSKYQLIKLEILRQSVKCIDFFTLFFTNQWVQSSDSLIIDSKNRFLCINAQLRQQKNIIYFSTTAICLLLQSTSLAVYLISRINQQSLQNSIRKTCRQQIKLLQKKGDLSNLVSHNRQNGSFQTDFQ